MRHSMPYSYGTYAVAAPVPTNGGLVRPEYAEQQRRRTGSVSDASNNKSGTGRHLSGKTVLVIVLNV